MDFLGFERPNDMVGIRNTVLVMAAADCAEPAAGMIAAEADNAVSVSQYQGCIDMQVVPTLVGVARNPNVYGTLLVAMGCEGQEPGDLCNEIAKAGKPVEVVNIQEVGGTRKAVSIGRKIVGEMARAAKAQQRIPFDISRLVVGVKCGGSDTTSGIAANPAIGVMADMLIDSGAAVVMGEPIEAIGAEEALSARALDDDVRADILKWIADEEKRKGLLEILRSLRPPKDIGFIIRTAGLNQTKKELGRDLKYLLRLWKVVGRRIKKNSRCPISWF